MILFIILTVGCSQFPSNIATCRINIECDVCIYSHFTMASNRISVVSNLTSRSQSRFLNILCMSITKNVCLFCPKSFRDIPPNVCEGSKLLTSPFNTQLWGLNQNYEHVCLSGCRGGLKPQPDCLSPYQTGLSWDSVKLLGNTQCQSLVIKAQLHWGRL